MRINFIQGEIAKFSPNWARAFDLARPDACIVCINGQTGYVFVD